MHCFFYLGSLSMRRIAVRIQKEFTAVCLRSFSNCGHVPATADHYRAVCLNHHKLQYIHWPGSRIKTCLRQLHNGVTISRAERMSSISYLSEIDAFFCDMKSGFDENNMSGLELAQFVNETQRASYSELTNLPWLNTNNTGLAFMQLVLNNNMESLLGPVINNEVMQQVLQKLRDKLSEVPDEECPTLLMSLICLGVDETDVLVSRLLDRLVDTTGQMDINRLAKVAEVLKCMQKRHYQLTMQMIHRLQELTFKETDIDFIQSFCFLNTNLINFMSKDLLEQLSDRFLEIIERKKVLSDPSDIAACINYCRNIHFAVGFRGKENALKIADVAKKSIPGICSKLEAQHISQYCHNLKKMHLYNGSLVDVLQQRSLEELASPDSSLCIRDIVDFSFAFTRNCSQSTKNMFVSLVINKIEDIDVLSLSDLCEVMLDLHLYEPALVNAVQTKTLELFDNLSLYRSKFSKVLHLLTKATSEDGDFKSYFIQRLLELTDSLYGIDPRSLCIISLFILPNVKPTIPDILMERLEAVIPQCNLKLLCHILDGLNMMQKPWLRQLHNQVLDLKICIQNNITERIESVTDIETMIKLIKSSYLHSSKKEKAILELIMGHLPKVTKCLTSVQLRIMVPILRRLHYYHPEVFEDLVKHMLQNNPKDDLRSVISLVSLLSRTGYMPQDSIAFSTFSSNLLELALEDDPIVALVLALDLAQLQIFPDSSICKIFSVDFLEQIDNRIETVPAIQSHVEGLMMKLNRSVVLECPQLDVPWFHEEFCAEKINSKVKSSDFFEADVEKILCDEFGIKDYFRAGVFSPYYYYINFELLLDSKNCPVTFASSKGMPDTEFQRVAVLLQHEVNFCTNSFRLKSYHHGKIRHLEILGYKVVLVPHYEWTSMALSDAAERAKYLREKICS